MKKPVMNAPKPASRDSIIAAFEEQAGWCDRLGSPFNAALLRDLAKDLDRDGPLADLVDGWNLHPVESALPLRVTGALHAIALTELDGDLAAVYPPNRSTYDAKTWAVVRETLVQRRAEMSAFLQSPPQTNEVRRSIILLGGFLAASQMFGRPLSLLEIGASAGLNLAWPNYGYRTETWHWNGQWNGQWGVQTGTIITTEWHGPPPAIAERPVIASRRGCDPRPSDLATAEDRLRLRAYIWPDQRDRLQRLEAAIATTQAQGIAVERAAAEDWLASRLAERPTNACTVVFHSVVWQYIAADARQRIATVIETAGRNATAEAPLCHLRFEPEDGIFRLKLRTWPDGADRELAEADPHGRWVRWRS